MVRTGSGASAVQVVWSYRGNRPQLTHIGSAHSDEQLAVLKLRARRLIDNGQLAFDLEGLEPVGHAVASGSVSDPLPVVEEKAVYLLQVIDAVFKDLGLDAATGGDRVFYDLVAARIIEPGSKLASIQTLASVGVKSASYATIKRRLPTYATSQFRARLTRALASWARIGPGVLVLYDVTTLYFETDTPDELRRPGFSKERRLEPQITVGLLTDAAGMPLSVGAFEGNRAETHTMLPMINQLRAAYQLEDITVVADAGMFNAANKQAITQAGLNYILAVKTPHIPAVIARWREDNPHSDYTDGQTWTQTLAGRKNSAVPHAVTYYQYSQSRARRSLRGINEQLAKAQRAVAGKTPIKRNKYLTVKAADKQINYPLVEKHLALAGIKGYETNRTDLTAHEVITYYRRLLKIEKAFRMAKSDLKARPIYHHTNDAIQAHLTIVMAAIACANLLEQRSGMSLKQLVTTLKNYRAITIEANGQKIHAQKPLPPTLTHTINKIQKPH